MKHGFEGEGQSATVATMPGLLRNATPLEASQPVVVVGCIKEFLDKLHVEDDGTLTLFGRRVTAMRSALSLP